MTKKTDHLKISEKIGVKITMVHSCGTKGGLPQLIINPTKVGKMFRDNHREQSNKTQLKSA